MLSLVNWLRVCSDCSGLGISGRSLSALLDVVQTSEHAQRAAIDPGAEGDEAHDQRQIDEAGGEEDHLMQRVAEIRLEKKADQADPFEEHPGEDGHLHVALSAIHLVERFGADRVECGIHISSFRNCARPYARRDLMVPTLSSRTAATSDSGISST